MSNICLCIIFILKFIFVKTLNNYTRENPFPIFVRQTQIKTICDTCVHTHTEKYIFREISSTYKHKIELWIQMTIFHNREYFSYRHTHTQINIKFLIRSCII